jgi:hypothetical protein
MQIIRCDKQRANGRLYSTAQMGSGRPSYAFKWEREAARHINKFAISISSLLPRETADNNFECRLHALSGNLILGPGDIIANVMPPSGADGRAILESGIYAIHTISSRLPTPAAERSQPGYLLTRLAPLASS